jgi:hypothetical protein
MLDLIKCSECNVYTWSEEIVRSVVDIDGIKVIALGTDPPNIAQTKTIITDFSKGCGCCCGSGSINSSCK